MEKPLAVAVLLLLLVNISLSLKGGSVSGDMEKVNDTIVLRNGSGKYVTEIYPFRSNGVVFDADVGMNTSGEIILQTSVNNFLQFEEMDSFELRNGETIYRSNSTTPGDSSRVVVEARGNMIIREARPLEFSIERQAQEHRNQIALFLLSVLAGYLLYSRGISDE